MLPLSYAQIGTFSGATIGISLGTNVSLGFLGCCGCMLLNSITNLSMSCNWLSTIVKVVYGPVFLIICTNSLTALVACSVVDNPGIVRCCGENFTTYACIYPLVFGV